MTRRLKSYLWERLTEIAFQVYCCTVIVSDVTLELHQYAWNRRLHSWEKEFGEVKGGRQKEEDL